MHVQDLLLSKESSVSEVRFNKTTALSCPEENSGCMIITAGNGTDRFFCGSQTYFLHEFYYLLYFWLRF